MLRPGGQWPSGRGLWTTGSLSRLGPGKAGEVGCVMRVGIEVSLDPEVRELLSEEVRTLKEKGQPC